MSIFFRIAFVMAVLAACDAVIDQPTSSLFLPVLHNLMPHQVVPGVVLGIFPEDLGCWSISLRHAGAMEAVEAATQRSTQASTGMRRRVGVSSASSASEISHAASLGVDYISTKVCEKSLVKAALAVDLPIMTGVSSVEEAMQALQWGSTALKFYPSSAVPPRKLKAILKALRATYGSQYIAEIPVIVAGGVTEADLTPYLSAGATGFAVGFDCNEPLDSIGKMRHFHKSAQMALCVTILDLTKGSYIAQEEKDVLFL